MNLAVFSDGTHTEILILNINKNQPIFNYTYINQSTLPVGAFDWCSGMSSPRPDRAHSVSRPSAPPSPHCTGSRTPNLPPRPSPGAGSRCLIIVYEIGLSTDQHTSQYHIRHQTSDTRGKWKEGNGKREMENNMNVCQCVSAKWRKGGERRRWRFPVRFPSFSTHFFFFFFFFIIFFFFLSFSAHKPFK